MSDGSKEAWAGGLTPEILTKLSRSQERLKFQRGQLERIYRNVGPGKVLWWRGRWRDYSELNASGKPPYRKRWLAPVCECSKSDAQRQLDLLIARTNLGEALPDVNVTFGTLWERYVMVKSARWGEGSRRAVIPVFRHHVLPTLGSRRVRDLTPWGLQQLVTGLAVEYSESLCQKVKVHLRASLEMAVEDDILAKNPARKLQVPQTKAGEERFLLLEEVQRLVAGLEGRDRLIVRLLVECGFRPGELFALRWDDWLGEFLRIDETAREGRLKRAAKNRASLGYVPVSGGVRVELEAWQRETGGKGDGLIFPSERGTAIHAGNFLRRNLKAIGKRLNVPGLTFQALRRTCSTHILSRANVKDSQRLLRHASATTTLKHYAKSVPESLALAVEAFSQEISGGDEVRM